VQPLLASFLAEQGFRGIQFNLLPATWPNGHLLIGRRAGRHASQGRPSRWPMPPQVPPRYPTVFIMGRFFDKPKLELSSNLTRMDSLSIKFYIPHKKILPFYKQTEKSVLSK
jgi:hypothetical protein